MRWEWYANRQDLLQVVVVDLLTRQLEEFFVKGRSDSLKCMDEINTIFMETLILVS